MVSAVGAGSSRDELVITSYMHTHCNACAPAAQSMHVNSPVRES